MANPLKNALEAQLNEARILQDKLQRDQRLFGTPNGYDWLRDGEIVHAHSTFTVGRWRSAYVEYTLPGYVASGSPWFVAGAALGNVMARSATRRQAEQQAAAQWRYYGAHAHLLTNQRVLSFLDGQWEWLELPWVEIYPDLSKATGKRMFGFPVDLVPASGEPLRLFGPHTPWWAVALVYLRYSSHGLQHPGLTRLTKR